MTKSPTEFTYNAYINGVLSGEIVTGGLLKLAVQRHMNDMKRQRTEEFSYWFDEITAQRWIKFAQLCRHWKGAKARERIILEPWQQFHFAVLFGWKRMDGTRRFRSSYTEVARKNGKTTLCAVKALAHLKLDNEAGAQVYFAATKEDQARIGFGDVQKIIKATPGLDEFFKVFTKSVTMGDSFMKPLGSDSDTQDGYDPSYGIIDEYHAHPDSTMLNVIESGMGSRVQPMIDIITTAGFDRLSPCYSEVRKTSIEILNGVKQDESHFAMIFAGDKGDDWKDPATWIKSNPNLGVSVRLEFLKDRFTKARNEGGSKEVDFKTKNLNIWTDALAVWIPDEDWKACETEFSLDDLMEYPCYFALDLASTMDTTCLSLLFDGGDRLYLLPCFFIPEETMDKRSKKDGLQYAQWARDGHMIITPGNVTDYDYIRKLMNDLKAKGVKFVKGYYDDWNTSDLIPRLIDDGFEFEPLTQNIKHMSTPTKEFEKMVYQHKLTHNGHPVLRWQMGNVMIKRDANENYKICKDKSTEKVDGPVAGSMAVAAWMKYHTQENDMEVMIW